MATEPDVYYPLNRREKIAVRLFRADIWPSDFDKIKVKKHFKYHGICVAEVSHYMAASWLKTNSINDWKRRGHSYWKRLWLFIVVNNNKKLSFSFVSRCSHVWCRSRRFDCILLVFFRQWGRLVMRDQITTYWHSYSLIIITIKAIFILGISISIIQRWS